MGWREMVENTLGTTQRTYGEAVTYRRDGDEYTLSGIFRDSYEGVDPGLAALVSSERPLLGIRLSDLPIAPDHKQPYDQVVVRGITYEVVDVRDDGEGGSTLHLHKVGA